MPQPTTAIYLNSQTPNAAPGFQTGKFASDGGTPMQSVTVAVPSTGNVNQQAANYTLQASDCGTLVVINSANAVIVTLPQTVPFAQWTCEVSSIGAGSTTLYAGNLQLDGSSSNNITLSQGQSCYIATDGTNYFSAQGKGSSGNGGGGGGGNVTFETNGTLNTSQSTLNLIAGNNIVLTNTAGGNVMIDSTASGGSSGLTVGTPVVRGSALSSTDGSGSSFTVTIPAGAQPGDFALLLYGGGWMANNPTGWQVLYNSNGLENINAAAWWKLLTTEDITAGSVTVTATGAYDGNLGIVVLTGQTSGIRTYAEVVDTGSTSSPQSLATDAILQYSDLVISFGAVRASSSIACDFGTQLQQATDGANASSVINAGPALSIGSVSPSFSWSGTDPFAAVVIAVVGTVQALPPGLWSGIINTPTLSSPLNLSGNMNLQGSFVSTAAPAGISLADLTGKGSDFVEGILDTYPTAPFTLTWLSNAYSAGSYNNCGLLVASGLTGEVMMFGYRWGSGGPWNPWVLTYSTPNSSPGTAATPSIDANGLGWFSYYDDSSNITFSYSPDGIYYIQLYSVSKASSYLGSSGFNYIGFGLEAYSGVQMSILSLSKS